MAKVMSLDYETYSNVGIKSCGAFRYIDDDSFDVLLMAYAFDDEPVKVIDVAQGESVPVEVISALYNPAITKSAYNAAFERAVSLKFFGRYCPPEQWEDTMVLAATCGLPLSLDGAGKALGLGEDKAKDKDGKALIKYFCTPCKATKTNGMRTRNLPEHDPDAWARFKSYNAQDVVSERYIRNLLLRWRPDETEHRFWCLDARINERGMRADLQLARNAVDIDAMYKAELTGRAVAITGLDNPKSVAQVKSWLMEQEGIDVPSLNKKVVADVVSRLSTDAARSFMALRTELAKTSTSKYEAVIRCACKDDHVRGCFQFYGANRTGRFCLTGDHEVLTYRGWQRLDEWQGGYIACWTPTGEAVSFQKAEAVQFQYSGPMYTYEDKRISQTSTPDHKMYVKPRYDKNWMADTVENMTHYRPSIPFTGHRATSAHGEPEKLRVLVMVQADGHYTPDGTIKLGFKKLRKVERCKTLLRRAGVVYSYRIYEDRHQFQIASRDVPLWLRQFRDKTFGPWLLDENPDVFFDELANWDGYYSAANSIQYTTCNKQNADIIQAFAHLSGRAAQLKTRARGDEHPNWSDAYVLDIWQTPTNQHEIRSKPTIEDFDGTVYCAVTPTGYFLVRRNGRVWVTGNSGRLVQLQNLPQNHMEDLAEARSLVRAGEYETVKLLYDNVAGTLSELIRTVLLPEPDSRFIVCDYSAIEARVIAWIAGEDWRLDVFRNGGDIYCASASQMFKVPVEKHGQNAHLRQKGKVAELALGYGGGINALKAFGADKLGMTDEEMVQTVDLWRSSSPRIVELWASLENAAKKCITRKTTAVSTLGHIRFDWEQGVMWMTLPSSRRIAYFGAAYEQSRWKNGKAISYMGVNQQTKKWERVETWGGKLTENLVQATARDCLRDAMLGLEDAGFDIRAHVHDEVIITEPLNSGRGLDDVVTIMGRDLPWAPGLPLRGDGYETPFYKKD